MTFIVSFIFFYLRIWGLRPHTLALREADFGSEGHFVSEGQVSEGQVSEGQVSEGQVSEGHLVSEGQFLY